MPTPPIEPSPVSTTSPTSPPSAGPERVAALRELADVTDDAYRDLRRIDVGSADHLVGPLGDARGRILEARHKALEGLRKARVASAAAVRLFEGPNRYLLVASNNAEMRAGSGMFLSAAEIVAEDGRLRLGAVNPTADLVLPEGTVPVHGDLRDQLGLARSGQRLPQPRAHARTSPPARRWRPGCGRTPPVGTR